MEQQARPDPVISAFTHVALCVADLRSAEALYADLFDMKVAFREAPAPEGWATLPSDAGWDDAVRAGITLGLVMLVRGDFHLALEAVDAVPGGNRLSHVGVFMGPNGLAAARERAIARGCAIVTDRANLLVFDDPLGTRWELTTASHDDPRALSNGARNGRWLTVGDGERIGR